MDSSQATETQRPDYLAEILSLCTTLSSEAIDGAEKKAKENEFNIDRGEISFAEVAINLVSAREVLTDAISKQKLGQLPITVQKELLGDLQAVSKALQGLMSNADEIVNLGNAVEALNTSIWKYGLHNLSDQVLGYQTKLNQIKQQEVRAKNLIATVENGHAAALRLIELSQQAENATDQIGKLRLSIEEEAKVASASRQQAQEENTKAGVAAAAAAQVEAQANQSSSAIKTAATEIAPLESSIKSFFQEIGGYRQQIATLTDEARKFLAESNASISKMLSESNATIVSEIDKINAAAKSAGDAQALALASGLEANSAAYKELAAVFSKNEIERVKVASEATAAQLKKDEDEASTFFSGAEKKLSELEANLKLRSEETIEKNNEETKTHLEELAALKDRVKEQIAQATGLGQFGAFQSRQNRISKGKFLWVGAIGVLAFSVVGLTYWIAKNAGQGDLHSAAFWIKISMNVPLGFLITFCTIQYNRERRLEEEYAFKASISISLTPYRDLIYAILEKDGNLKDGSYTKFVIEAVNNVFSSPTERVFESSKGIQGIPEKALKNAAELIGTAVKAAK